MTLPVLLSIYLLVHLIMVVKSPTWPSTKGKLLQFKVDERTMKVKFPSLMEDSKFCILKIKYEYRVRDKQYQGTRIQFGKEDAYITPEELERSEFYSNVRKGNFPVYYAEGFPWISTLKTGISTARNHLIGICFVMSFGSLVYLMYVVSLGILGNTAK